MQRFLTLRQIRAIELQAINQHHIDLIDMAGCFIAHWIQQKIDKKSKILIVIGGGNNGADGVSTAIKLIALGYKVMLWQVITKLNPTTKKLLSQIKDTNKLSIAPNKLTTYAVIIDAIFGIGINHTLDPKILKIIQSLNNSGRYILSIDTPSGLDPFSGNIYGGAIKANATITFISDKPGFYTGYGSDCVGEIILQQLINPTVYGMPKSLNYAIVSNQVCSINYAILRRNLHNTSKGNFGTVAIIGGNKGMHGALYLCGRAAMLHGSGRVILAPIDNEFISDLYMPEIMLRTVADVLKNISNYSVVIIGPGMGTDNVAVKILTKLLSQPQLPKLIFDADALNLIAQNQQLYDRFYQLTNKIITPHPLEASRLLDCSIEVINNNRFTAIKNLYSKFNAITLLKGYGSLIIGDNKYIYLNETGNAALSGAGQGDVLCGIIAAFIAQGVELLPALRLAAYLHGSAGEVLSKSIGYNGILASEVSQCTRGLLNKLLYN